MHIFCNVYLDAFCKLFQEPSSYAMNQDATFVRCKYDQQEKKNKICKFISSIISV